MRQNIATRFRTAAVALLLSFGSALGLGAVPAAATGVPPDPSAKGFIGLCDKNNHNVTHGNIDTAPFVWKAVASVPPPKQLRGRGQNAVLNIYQPRPETLAGDWSGDQLTAATFYSTARAPSTQSTLKDIPLKVIVNEYPPMVEGLYELRMYFAKSNYGLYSATYPATYIRVAGGNWSVVKGGTVNCAASSGQSAEVISGAVSPKTAYGTATPQAARGRPSGAPTLASPVATSAGTTTQRGSQSSRSQARGSQSPVSNESTVGSATQDVAASGGGSSSALPWWITGLAAAAAAALGVAWWRTRRRQT